MIKDPIIDKLSSLSIVDVVSEYVTLKKSGVNYKGLCPFHDDKNPSFMVSPAKNICHCFVCGKGGTPIHFIMEHEKFTKAGGSKTLEVAYKGDADILDVNTDVDWATVKRTDGKITIKVAAGTTAREGTITVSDGYNSVEIAVKQTA